MLEVQERPVDLPTTVELRRMKQEREQAKDYAFHLTARTLHQVNHLSDAAILAYALIRAAAWGDRADDWVTISARALSSLDRGYRWWHAATTQLADAGVIEVERHRGRMPRYRLVSKKGASK